MLQRFNKKDSATSEEPDERDLRDLIKFIEDDTRKSLCKHLFAASGAMFSIATHIMTLETLFSHPAEYAKRHRESPEVQSFKQNPSRESMVAYIASQTLSHTEIVPEEEEGGSIWDTLTQRSSGRQARPTATFWDAVQENVEDEEPQYPYDEDDQEEDIPAPTRRRSRRNILEEEDDEDDKDHEPFNTPESSGEHALFITQEDPDPYHEPGTLSRSQKGKHQPREKGLPQQLTFGPGLGSVPRAAHRPLPLHQQRRENPPQLVPEEAKQPGEPREEEEEEHEGKEDTLQAATRTLTSAD